jgi:hypothetical protein
MVACTTNPLTWIVIFWICTTICKGEPPPWIYVCLGVCVLTTLYGVCHLVCSPLKKCDKDKREDNSKILKVR